MTPIEPFFLHDPLPRGRLAIEASAGTGKTYALSSLAARYIAEDGVAIDELLIVTFTRAAAAELKDRVRSRLVDFAGLLAFEALPEDRRHDEFAGTVWSADPHERRRRVERVRAALTSFDSATITTIHGFAQQILGTLGSASASDPDAVLLDDSSSLITQVATDLLVAEALAADTDGDVAPDLQTPPGLQTLCTAARLALGNPEAVLVPAADEPDLEPRSAKLRELIDRARNEVERRRRLAATQSFDDLLSHLNAATAHPEFGAAAREAIQRRYRVALIDEFQDTDPVQWSIFDAVFGHADGGDGSSTSLVLVGDPKQAIYGFRGANVHTYLRAVRNDSTDRRSLATNWRSDPAVLTSVQHLLDGATFGDADIGFQPVDWPQQHDGRRFEAADGSSLPALSLRLVDNDHVPRVRRGDTRCAAAAASSVVYDEMAVYLRNLLETAVIPDADSPGGSRPLRPDDIAVLVSANYEPPTIQAALGRLGIPAVVSRGDSVLTCDAASHWHRLLAAVARPTDPRRARAAALTWFWGKDAEWAADVSEEEMAELHEQLHAWGEHLTKHGTASFIGRIRSESALIAQVLSLDEGDRAMTDVEHIAELLVLAGGARQSPATLLALYEQLSGGTDDGNPEADHAARRVESEASAVQIMTTFVAKGLEFPVVCCPSLFSSIGVKVDHNVWWDEAAQRRVIDVASEFPWGPEGSQLERQQAAATEAVGTNLRVLYVALTRARHHTAVWWLPTEKARRTGLARVLFARTGDGQIDPEAYTAEQVDVPFGVDAVDALRPLVEASAGTLDVQLVGPPTDDDTKWAGSPLPEQVPLHVASVDRTLPRDSARWSFTAITAHGGGHAHSIDPSDPTMGDSRSSDEQRTDVAPIPSSETDATGPEQDGVPLPLGDIAGGAGFGNLVHKVFEDVDFAAPDLAAALTEAVETSLRWNQWPVDPARLVDGLLAVLDTPLGPLFGGTALRDLHRSDRLDELSFDLTLGLGGEPPSDADIGRVLLDHLPDDDPLQPWAQHLAAGPFGTRLSGHLTGSIDLVARIRGGDAPDRFVVCDYKSNRLAPGSENPTARSFEPGRLATAMADADYGLQALLYSVALHRYLRWRIPAYDPQVHLGGVGYLFVRGMVGPDTPVHAGAPNGLFEWHPPAELITATSDLLDGRSPSRVGAR